MMRKDAPAHIQFFSRRKTNKLIGIARINAVKAESWRGDIFFREIIDY
jgi:hypothetical protein